MKKICEYCSKQFESKNDIRIKYCSEECRNKAYTGIQGLIRNCKYCNKEFQPKENSIYYCSKSCGLSGRSGKTKYQIDLEKEKRKKELEKNCIICGSFFIAKNKASRTCSDDCYIAYKHQLYLEYKPSEDYKQKLLRDKIEYNKGIKERVLTCVGCGKEFTVKSRRDRKYCSYKCSTKEQRINSNHIRRQRVRRQRNGIVRKKEIYKRDNYICQLCGGKVDMDECSPHPFSATIDHVKPLSKGGLHEPVNCQLAHFICNSFKGNKENLSSRDIDKLCVMM